MILGGHFEFKMRHITGHFPHAFSPADVFPLDLEITFSATDVINAVKHDEGSSISGHQ